ncbi:MAG: hypothetical protein ACOX4A_02345 [Saccharofermentanales bacterium]|jgi:hypothetical protein
MKTFLMTTILPVLMVDPPTEVTEPATKLFQIIKYLCLVAGGIVILLGLVQFGTSQMNQDPAGRQKAFFVLLGGIVITAAPFILQLLIPSLTF